MLAIESWLFFLTVRDPMDEVLTLHDLGSLVNLLEDGKVEWVAIATQLGVPEVEIQAIHANHNGNFSRCLREALVLWLKGIDPLPTRGCLLAALMAPSVGMEGLAMEFMPPGHRLVLIDEDVIPGGPPLQRPCRTDVLCCIFAVLLAVAVSSVLLYCYQSTCFRGKSFFLPKRDQLIGREDEMTVVLEYLNQDSPRVDMVTLHGQAGFGKSEIAKHVGHTMLKMCVDVYYILVEICPDVECLKLKLMEISGLPYSHITLERWGQGLTRRTLLILDNVDGKVWMEEESRQEFQTDFLHIVLAQSTLLQVLITSQQNIQSSEQVFRSYPLLSLSLNNCVKLTGAISETQGIKISASESENICDLVGNVPKAIRVLCASFSSENSVSYVIETLNETSNKLGFMASNAGFVDKDRLLSAMEIGFRSVMPKFQVCSLLLVRLPGTFSLDLAAAIITPDMLKGRNYSFSINDCLRALSAKSILEKISIETQIHELHVRYHFHELVTDLLDNIESKHDITDLLEVFWRNYVDWLSNDTGEVWLLEDLGKQDLDAMGRILNRNDHYSYIMAIGLSASALGIEFLNEGASMKSGLFEYWNERAPNWQLKIANTLLSACEGPDSIYPVLSVDSIINAYVVVFEEVICTNQGQDCIDKLATCQPKIEQLHNSAKGSYEAMEASSDFHNFLQMQCSLASTPPAVCDSTWKYRLLRLAFNFVLVKRRCTESCQTRKPRKLDADCRKTVHVILGLEYYSLIADDRAIKHLSLAVEGESSSEYAFLNSVAYMTLYAIHSKQKNGMKMEESLVGFLNSIQNASNMSYHWIFYDRDMFAEFLTQVNIEEKLAQKLSDLEIGSYITDVGKEDMLKCQSEQSSVLSAENTLFSVEDSLSVDKVEESLLSGKFSPYQLKGVSVDDSVLSLCGCSSLGEDYADYRCICFVSSED